MNRIIRLTFLFASTLLLLSLGVKSAVYADPGDIISRQFVEQVFYGYPGDTEEPLEGLMVALFGSYDEEPLTDPLVEATTDPVESFRLPSTCRPTLISLFTPCELRITAAV